MFYKTKPFNPNKKEEKRIYIWKTDLLKSELVNLYPAKKLQMKRLFQMQTFSKIVCFPSVYPLTR